MPETAELQALPNMDRYRWAEQHERVGLKRMFKLRGQPNPVGLPLGSHTSPQVGRLIIPLSVSEAPQYSPFAYLKGSISRSGTSALGRALGRSSRNPAALSEPGVRQALHRAGHPAGARHRTETKASADGARSSWASSRG